MRRRMKLAALLVVVAVLMSGCMMDLSGLTAGTNSNPAAEPTVKPTDVPMTAPVFTDRDAVYEWYNEVNIGDTLDDLKARYGEPTVSTDQNGDLYTWVNEEGYGFSAVFFTNGLLRAKVIQYEDIRQLKDLSLATSLTNFSLLDTDDDFTMVCLALGGKPCELMSMAEDSSANPNVQRVFVWLDEYGSSVQVQFSAKEKVMQIGYALADRTE